MLRMIGFELQKILGRGITKGAIAALLVSCLFLLQAFCWNNPYDTVRLPDGAILSGRDAIAYNQSVAARYEGDLTDETLQQIAEDFAREYPQDYQQVVQASQVSSDLPAPYRYLSQFVPGPAYQQEIQRAQEAGIAIPSLTSAGLIRLQDLEISFVEKPLQYGYGDSWSLFFQSFCGPAFSAALLILLVSVIGVSTLLAGEYDRGTDALILTTKYGKNRVILAKLLAGILFATFLTAGVFLLFCAAFGLQCGVAGWSADMQTVPWISLFNVNIPLNNLELLLLGFLIVWVSAVVSAVITAMISALAKTSVASLLIAICLAIAPYFLHTNGESPWCVCWDLWMWAWPINAVNLQHLLRLPIAYNLGAYDTLLLFGGTAIILFLLSVVIAYHAFRRHRIGG